MSKRCNTGPERVIRPETLTQLTDEIGDVIDRHNGLPRWEANIRTWYDDEWCPRLAAAKDLDQRRKDYARRVEREERLRDEAAGPPFEGWLFEIVDTGSNPENLSPLNAADVEWVPLFGWVPPELSQEAWDALPKAEFPLPLTLRLPRRELTLPEKYTALGAVYNWGSGRGDEIKPWRDTPEHPGIAAFKWLVEQIAGTIPESDAVRLRRALKVVEADLASVAANGKPGQQPGKKPEMPMGDVPIERRPATGTDPGARPTRKHEERAIWLAKAMLFVRDHPDWSNAEIARCVGVHPATLSRSREYQTAAAMARESKNNLPRGHITVDPDSGLSDVEAYTDGQKPEEIELE